MAFFRAVLTTEAKRSALIVPDHISISVVRSNSQTVEQPDSQSRSHQVPLKGSFMSRVVEKATERTAAVQQDPDKSLLHNLSAKQKSPARKVVYVTRVESSTVKANFSASLPV